MVKGLNHCSPLFFKKGNLGRQSMSYTLKCSVVSRWLNEHVLVTSSFQYQWAPNIEKFDFQFLLTMQVGGAQT